MKFKKYYSDNAFKEMFPNLYGDNYVLNEDIFGSKSAGEYIRKSYRGGWCYVKKLYQGIKVGSGCVADVNSLYPSVMQDKNNTYPVGNPHNFYKAIPKMVLENPQKYYFFVFQHHLFYLDF